MQTPLAAGHNAESSTAATGCTQRLGRGAGAKRKGHRAVPAGFTRV